VLASCGRIFPSTAANVSLEAVLEDGRVIAGESRISKSKRAIETDPDAASRLQNRSPRHCTRLRIADLHLAGSPASLFTSVIPNLLVKGIPAAIEKSPANQGILCKLMWQAPERDHEFSCLRSCGRHPDTRRAAIAGLRDREHAPHHGARLKRRYAKQNALPVENDADRVAQMGVKVVGLEAGIER